jgi:uncharacterized protein
VADLAARNGERCGRVLVNAYRQAGGDPGDDALIAFYAARRALIRAKVAYVRSAQLEAGSDERQRGSGRGRALIGLAEGFAWRARLPLAIVVCGVRASGKTSIARELSHASVLTALNSDLTRKRLADIATTQRGTNEVYGPEWNKRTYAELGRNAGRAVADEGGVIVDATFRHRDDREAFAHSFGAVAPLVFVECQAPPAALRARAAKRDRDPARISDAGQSVVERERTSWTALDEVPGNSHVLLRTDRPLEAAVAELTAVLDERLKRSG